MATKNQSAGMKAAATKAANKAAAMTPATSATKAVPKVVLKAGKPAEPAATPKPVKTAKVQETEEYDETHDASDSGAMGRKQLADSVRSRLQESGFGISHALALATIQAFEAVVENAMAAGSEVSLPGFGKFKVTLRQGGERRNPRSGEPLHVASAWAPSFKVGKTLKDAANTRPTE